MKKMFILILLLIYSTTYGQKTILYFKTGDSIVGFSKGISYSSIKFSEEKKGKYKKIDIKNIDKVILYYKEGKEEYHHLKEKKRKKTDEFYARLVSSGKINYYIYSTNFRNSFTSYQKINLGNGTVINRTTQNNNNRSVNLFYLKKEKDEYSTYISDVYFSITGEKVFRKNASNFFDDCKKLVNKIKSKEFKKSDIYEIIEFYERDCD